MKLTIIPLVNPTEQQYLDLYKIWPDQKPDQLAHQCQSEQKIYAARFNDRLLAAAKIHREQHTGTIYDFLVREVTRRRGVGLYLLDEICRQEPQITHWYFSLEGVLDADKIVMEQFLLACRFTPTQESHRWEKRV
ncbi:aspartate 1-decarboxylase autocleavage activator PanM [Providencia stuartii]|uniref:aspartate 1-decarboxylase autocleavage activator PanM n=1 Tax=Providencia TaxID=586 RepID=UPI00234AA52E|nr:MULTISPECIES: aspartate 1-decarboxylase autocleavage activator PanM [Providencia]MDN0019183.1 aspartate 1-decarboxylase autocleavage activator PanM [Providencia stuartii]HEM8877994.1 aspartate 1-decarboxylase autocleavage activator PanM [Providencia stuartii]